MKFHSLRTFVLTFPLLFIFQANASVLVTNVAVTQREGTKLVDISYDVFSDHSDTVSVNVLISNQITQIQTPSLSGDIGSNVSVGVGKNIIWDGRADRNGNVTTGLSITVSAEDENFYPVDRFVRYSFTLTNQKGSYIPQAQFWVRVPVSQTAHQKLERYEASHSHQVSSDSHGNKTLYFQFNNFPPYARTTVEIEAWLDMAPDPAPDVPISPSMYLGAAEYIEIDNADFQSLAPEFAPGPVDQVAENIMNWVHNNVQDLGYVNTPNGALYALQQRKGDGTEMMYLFVALCRANGIPARPMVGYICTQNSILHAYGVENWAEYFDGERWQLVDAHDRVFEERGSEYVALGVAVSSGSVTHSSRYKYAGDGLTVKTN